MTASTRPSTQPSCEVDGRGSGVITWISHIAMAIRTKVTNR